jgi:hypothetical protein
MEAALVFGPMYLGRLVFSFLAFLSPWLLLCGFAAFAIWIGRRTDSLIHTKAFTFAIPFVLIAIPLIWMVASYQSFERLCAEAPLPSTNKIATNPAIGFFVDDDSLREFERGKQTQTPFLLLESEEIAYFDYKASRFDPNAPKEKLIRRTKKFSNKGPDPSSLYAFHVSVIAPIANPWHGPLYRATYSVQQVGDSLPVAIGSEYVFGGGIIGIYTQAILGERGDYQDRDFKYLACGYASKTPTAWRPRFNTNPSFDSYFRADRELLRPILSLRDVAR